MLSTGCQKYYEQFKRHFGWLFDEYSFTVVHVEDRSSMYCNFILQSGDCRVSVEFDRGGLAMEIAMVPKAIASAKFIPGLKWYGIPEVLDFLEGRSPDYLWIEERAQGAVGVSLEEKLADEAQEYRSSWPQIMEFFEEDEFERRRDEFERFRESQHQKLATQHIEWTRRQEAQ